MNRLGAARSKKRLSCLLRVGPQRQRCLILDLSTSGLFVQTSGSFASGTLVTIELAVPGVPEPLELEGVVARRKRVPATLRSVVPQGIGVQISDAPEEYHRFVAKIQEGDPGA